MLQQCCRSRLRGLLRALLSAAWRASSEEGLALRVRGFERPPYPPPLRRIFFKPFDLVGDQFSGSTQGVPAMFECRFVCLSGAAFGPRFSGQGVSGFEERESQGGMTAMKRVPAALDDGLRGAE